MLVVSCQLGSVLFNNSTLEFCKMEQNPQFLVDTANMKMPFGKYKGTFLIDLPEHYIVWYKQKGFPKGKLGKMMGLVYELKLNGLEDILRKVRS